MLETFGMQKGGAEYRRLVAAFQRIFAATMFFGTETGTPRARVVQRSRFNFLREARIWYARDPTREIVSDEFDNLIVLSDEFYNEVAAHAVPTDLEAVKVLTASPGLLDLFVWLSYRRFVAKAMNRFHYSDHSELLHRSERATTPGPADYASDWRNG